MNADWCLPEDHAAADQSGNLYALVQSLQLARVITNCQLVTGEQKLRDTMSAVHAAITLQLHGICV